MTVSKIIMGDAPPGVKKIVDAHAAEFASACSNLHGVRKRDRCHFDIRRAGGSYTVSIIDDLNGLLARIGGSHA